MEDPIGLLNSPAGPPLCLLDPFGGVMGGRAHRHSEPSSLLTSDLQRAKEEQMQPHIGHFPANPGGLTPHPLPTLRA